MYDARTDIELDSRSAHWLKRQSDLLGGCAMYAVPREQHDALISWGFVEGTHFSHDPSPFNPTKLITYHDGIWNETVL